MDNGSLAGGTITVDPDPACIGDTITFTVSGVVDSGGTKRENCIEVPIPAVPPSFTWTLTIPPDYPVPLPPLSGSGPVVTVAAKVPGTYSATFTAKPTRTECPPDDITVGPKNATAQTTATLTLNPSTIPAKTGWPSMPAGLSESAITVTRNPPECVGRLEIVEVAGTGGYSPPGFGTLDRLDDTHWKYTAFDEPAPVACEKPVKVWIAALKGEVELDRKSVLVLPVHTYLTTGANVDFLKDFNYISWKYAAVLATTGGAFSGTPTISTTPSVTCNGVPGLACTTCIPLFGCSVEFGTSTFTGSEHRAASIIGHELVHAAQGVCLFGCECPAYQWEAGHSQQTGIWVV